MYFAINSSNDFINFQLEISNGKMPLILLIVFNASDESYLL